MLIGLVAHRHLLVVGRDGGGNVTAAYQLTVHIDAHGAVIVHSRHLMPIVQPIIGNRGGQGLPGERTAAVIGEELDFSPLGLQSHLGIPLGQQNLCA